MLTDVGKSQKSNWQQHFGKYMREHWFFYLLLFPALLDVLIFRYLPIYGVQIAFRQFKANLGILDSPWVGIKYFAQFANSPLFWQIMRNTFLLSFYTLLFCFPIAILLALMINELRNVYAKKFVQMVTYMPHFISTVAVIGLINLILDRDSGIVNMVRGLFGYQGLSFISMPSAFRTIYVSSEIWQHTGWNSIIYLAVLTAVDVEVLEAAYIDGANRFQKILFIDLPTIMPTMVMLLILSAGSILGVGFEKVYLMKNPLNQDVAQVIATYTYEIGILNGQISYTSAIGLFNTVINAVLLAVVNTISRKVSDISLW